MSERLPSSPIESLTSNETHNENKEDRDTEPMEEEQIIQAEPFDKSVFETPSDKTIKHIEPIKPVPKKPDESESNSNSNKINIPVIQPITDGNVLKLLEIVNETNKQTNKTWYWVKNEMEKFIDAFTKIDFNELSDDFFNVFVNKHMRLILHVVLENISYSYYEKEISAVITFCVSFFFDRIQLVNEEGWDIMFRLISYEKITEDRKEWNGYTRSWEITPSWLSDITQIICSFSGFEKLNILLSNIALKEMIMILNVVIRFFVSNNRVDLTEVKKNLGEVLTQRLVSLDISSEKFDLVQRLMAYAETFSEEDETFAIAMVQKFSANLKTFNNRKMFLKYCNYLYDKILPQRRGDIAFFTNLMSLSKPVLTILNESIQKEILIDSLNILYMLNNCGYALPIFNNCMDILTNGHTSIVEVIVPFMNHSLTKMEPETLNSLIDLLSKIEEKTISHFKIFVSIMKIHPELLEKMFELFFDNCEIEIDLMVNSLDEIVEVSSEGVLFNSLITKLREFMDSGYENKKKILFTIKVLNKTVKKGEYALFEEKEFVSLFSEIVENVVPMDYSQSQIDIIDSSLNVLLLLSLMNEEEIAMELFMTLWGIFMTEEIDKRIRSRLLNFFNEYFKTESEMKDFAILSLTEHIENEDEIMMFDSPEGVLLIQLIIESVNKEELIKKGDNYEFNGDINEISQISMLKKLLISTTHQETINAIMTLLAKFVKSISIHNGWKVVIDWINQINENDEIDTDKENELYYDLQLLNNLFSEWTEKEEGKSISHIKSLKGKEMMFKVTIFTEDGRVIKREMEISSKKNIEQIKDMILSENKIEKKENLMIDMRIEGITEFEEKMTIEDLSLPNEAEIELRCELKKVEEKQQRATTYSTRPIDHIGDVKPEEVMELQAIGFERKLAIYALCKYHYYHDKVNTACNALFEKQEELEMELYTAISEGDDFSLPGDVEIVQTKKSDVDTSFIKLVSNSTEIMTLFNTLRKDYAKRIHELVWKIIVSLPTFDLVMQKVKSAFCENEMNNAVYNLLTEESPYILLYTIQVIDSVLFPENDIENSTTDSTNESLLREQIARSQNIFDQFINSLHVVASRKNELIVEIIETYSRIFKFFIHKTCKYNHLNLTILGQLNIFNELFELMMNNPTDIHVSDVFINVVSSFNELHDRGYQCIIEKDIHKFVVTYFNSQQQYDKEHLITMKFINLLVEYHKRNQEFLQQQIPFYILDLFNCQTLYGTGKALFYYFKTITALMEISVNPIQNTQQVMNHIIETLISYEPQEQFTDTSDYYTLGLLKLCSILIKTSQVPENVLYELVKKIYHCCFSDPLIYKIRIVRNTAYELLDAIFNQYPSLIHPFSEEIFVKNFEFKITNKLGIVPKLSRTGHRGIRNLGVTCYINSTIQFLYLMEEFREKILRLIITDEMKVVSELQKLFISLKSGNQESYNANKLIDAVQISRKVTNLKSEQHDASDFFIKLMDSIEDELNEKDKKQILSTFQLILSNITESLESKVTQRNERQEQYTFLDLTMLGKKNVYECFKELFKPTTFTGENRLKTEDGIYYNAKKQTRMETLPHYLLLQLNRFETFDTQTRKIDDKCEMPLELDVTPYMKETSGEPTNENMNNINNQYRLKGVVIHSGTAISGHYFTYGHIDNQWILFDDDRISYAPEDVVIRNMNGYKNITGYLFVYEKVQWESSEMNIEIDDKIMQLIKEEEKKISDDIMYHDDSNIHFLLKHYEHFEENIRDKLLVYCCNTAFDLLQQGSENVSFVQNIIRLLHQCKPNQENGESILKITMKQDYVKQICFNKEKAIRENAVELINTAIRWIGHTDSIHLLDEHTVLFRFYWYIKGLLTDCRAYPTYLNDYFSIFDTIASIGPEVCYQLSQMKMLFSFWRFYDNKDDTSETKLKELSSDYIPNLKNFVSAFVKVLCSTYIPGKLKNTISPESNTMDLQYIERNGFALFLDDVCKDEKIAKLALFNVEYSKRMIKYLSYNNFKLSIVIMNQIKKEIEECVTYSFTQDNKAEKVMNLLSLSEAILEIEDEYKELRVQCLLNNFTKDSIPTICGDVNEYMIKGFLSLMSENSDYRINIVDFVLRMAEKHDLVKEFLMDNINTVETIQKMLNVKFTKAYKELKEVGMNKQPFKFAEKIVNNKTIEYQNSLEYHRLERCYSLYQLNQQRKLVIDEDLIRNSYQLVKEELRNYDNDVKNMEKSLPKMKDYTNPYYNNYSNNYNTRNNAYNNAATNMELLDNDDNWLEGIN